uniref:Uncharacterized protein n=1 Tax=Cannabis sativa TaxID=3483 RepID=A0A803QC41_CANSA
MHGGYQYKPIWKKVRARKKGRHPDHLPRSGQSLSTPAAQISVLKSSDLANQLSRGKINCRDPPAQIPHRITMRKQSSARDPAMAAAERRPSVSSAAAGLPVRPGYGTVGRSRQLLEKFAPYRSCRLSSSNAPRFAGGDRLPGRFWGCNHAPPKPSPGSGDTRQPAPHVWKIIGSVACLQPSFLEGKDRLKFALLPVTLQPLDLSKQSPSLNCYTTSTFLPGSRSLLHKNST